MTVDNIEYEIDGSGAHIFLPVFNDLLQKAINKINIELCNMQAAGYEERFAVVCSHPPTILSKKNSAWNYQCQYWPDLLISNMLKYMFSFE